MEKIFLAKICVLYSLTRFTYKVFPLYIFIIAR